MGDPATNPWAHRGAARCCALWFAVACCLSLSSQTVSTEILGLVTDASGAVVPGAIVKVRRLATGDVRSATTNETGNYIFPLLDTGEYEVTCSAPGFKTEMRRSVVLQLQEKARINFQMQVGEQMETVEIRGAPFRTATGSCKLAADRKGFCSFRFPILSFGPSCRVTRRADPRLGDGRVTSSIRGY